ncbi:RNA export factor gle2 [Entomophthora muscae]|uniref:RNA export factor gle2 n=1 Tax=Entomophthora muscae TaxID=34485 RepID=A0ACC2RJW2_9FUNG|nr:RNA export factor gle2 [Entomophthora muscae]
MSWKKDFDLPVLELPGKTVTKLDFHPNKDLLAIASFDNSVRLLDVDIRNKDVNKVSEYSHAKSVLACKWGSDGTRLASGCVDGVLKVLDAGTGQTLDIGKHDGAIKAVAWASQDDQIVATGSWDKTLKYWDLRSATCIQSLPLPGKCLSMDATFPLMVVATADRHIQIFDLNNPMQPYRETYSSLKWQTRSVCTVVDPEYGYLLGSLEGRAVLSYCEPKNIEKTFTFKCHRINDKPYAVNCVNVTPEFPHVVATAGGDGSFSFWNIKTRRQLSTHTGLPGPITAACFNSKATVYAYATGADFCELDAVRKYNGIEKVNVHFHPIVPEDAIARE